MGFARWDGKHFRVIPTNSCYKDITEKELRSKYSKLTAEQLGKDITQLTVGLPVAPSQKSISNPLQRRLSRMTARQTLDKRSTKIKEHLERAGYTKIRVCKEYHRKEP